MLDTVSHTRLVTNDRTNITQRLESELDYTDASPSAQRMETEGMKTMDASDQFFGRYERH